MVVSYLALIITVPLLPFDTSMAITQKGWDWIFSPGDITENLFVLDECYRTFGSGLLMKVCLLHVILCSKLFAVRFSSFKSKLHSCKPIYTPPCYMSCYVFSGTSPHAGRWRLTWRIKAGVSRKKASENQLWSTIQCSDLMFWNFWSFWKIP